MRLAAVIVLLAGGFAACVSAPPRPADGVRPPDRVLPHDSLTIQSDAVGELRRINVYTPPGYADDASTAYPVLYMPDGGIQEDFPHITDTIDALIRSGAIAPVLVVGIENTVRRRDLNGPTTDPRDLEMAPLAGGSGAFRRFIGDELMPEIRRRYRTTDQTAIVGESAAGSFVVETFFLEPDLFDRYLAMDPALYWNSRELVAKSGERLPGLAGRNLVLWLATGDTPGIQPAVAALADSLRAHAPADLRWSYSPRPAEHHGTIFRAAKADAFREALWANP